MRDDSPEGLFYLVHVTITGRDAHREILAEADLVTEMQVVKHPHKDGIKAQKGIEF